MKKIKKYKTPSFRETFAYGPSRLAKKTTAVAINKDEEEAWEALVKRFLEVSLFTTVLNAPQTAKKTAKTFLLTHQNHDRVNYYVILFENEIRAQDWLQYKSGLNDGLKSQASIEKYANGVDFLLSIKPNFFLDHKLMLDVGRRNKYIIDTHILNWMRKKAQAEKRRLTKNQKAKD